MKKTCIAVLLVLLAVGTNTASDDVKKEKEVLKGTWKLVSMESDGKAHPEDEVREANIRLTIGIDELHFSTDSDNKVFTIDPTASPKQLTFSRKKDDKATPKKARCIYSIDDMCLTICVGTDDRCPKAFKTKAGDPDYIMVFRREPK